MRIEMLDDYYRYVRRTVEHIHRVQKNMVTVVTDFKEDLKLSDEQCRVLMYNVMKHDRSKFSSNQFKPYVHLTRYYHQRKVLGNTEYQYPTEKIKQQVNIAVQDHYVKENHHPERLAAEGPPSTFKWFEAIETVCDLQAMAQEFNEGSCRKYFEETWKPKQSKHFHDDFNWSETNILMDKVITCFENNDT